MELEQTQTAPTVGSDAGFCPAGWSEKTPGKWVFRLPQAPPNVVAQVSRMERGADAGKYFWDHFPWKGEWGIADDLAEAKRLASACWQTQTQALPYAYCCNGDPATCDCVKPDHGTAQQNTDSATGG